MVVRHRTIRRSLFSDPGIEKVRHMYDENSYAAPESVSGFAPSVAMSGYYLSRSSRNFRRFLTVVGWLGFIASIAFTIIAGNMEIVAGEILFVTALVAIVGFLVMAIVGQLPISIDRHENGVKFWLKGFKQPFFDQLRVMYANAG